LEGDDVKWKQNLKKMKYEKLGDEMPTDVLGNDLRNLKGIIKVGKKNEGLYKLN